MTKKTKTESRALTPAEMRERFLSQIRAVMEYWLTTDLSRPELEAELERKGEVRYRLEGLVFSILVIVDGGTGGMPAVNLVAAPHPEDEDFHRSQGTNWWPAGTVLNDCQLHELWDKLLSAAALPSVAAKRETRLAAKLRELALKHGAGTRLEYVGNRDGRDVFAVFSACGERREDVVLP